MTGMDYSVLAAAAPLCETNEGGLIGVITDWLVSVMDAVGGIGVAFAIALESVFPPIPSEVILPLAGFTAARGSFNLIEAILWATVGSVLGAWVLYGISRWVGLHRIHRAVDKIPGVDRGDVDKANRWFTKYGHWSVLIGRVIPAAGAAGGQRKDHTERKQKRKQFLFHVFPPLIRCSPISEGIPPYPRG